MKYNQCHWQKKESAAEKEGKGAVFREWPKYRNVKSVTKRLRQRYRKHCAQKSSLARYDFLNIYNLERKVSARLGDSAAQGKVKK